MRRKTSVAELSFEEQCEKAFQRIMRTASICEQSTAKMRLKLERAGYGPSCIAQAMERACAAGAIDDERYCDCLVRQAVASGRGLASVEREICDLGLEPASVPSYAAYMADDGESAQIASAVALLKAHPPRAKNRRDAAYRKLVSKGFSLAIAAQAVSTWWNGLDRV